jgi:2-polyprenyl-3-methyl-5-hydroxy-6-metoxy-1,4-benzoquinol methylase
MNKQVKGVIEMYETPVQDGKSRFQLWEEGKNIGASVTPSTFNKKYLKEITETIVSLIKPITNPKILSVGCGNAFIELELSKLGYDILVTDVSPQALQLADKKGLKTMYFDAIEPTPIDGKFDLIMSDGVIGHLADEDASIAKFLENTKKLLNKKGVIFIANDTPTKSIDIQKHDGFSHIYWFSSSYFKEQLKSAGFTSIGSKYLEYFRPNYGQRKRVLVWGSK